jgi:hypothetical protein
MVCHVGWWEFTDILEESALPVLHDQRLSQASKVILYSVSMDFHTLLVIQCYKQSKFHFSM